MRQIILHVLVVVLLFDCSTCVSQGVSFKPSNANINDGFLNFKSHQIYDINSTFLKSKGGPLGLESFIYNGDLIVDGDIGVGTAAPSARMNIVTGNDVHLNGGSGYIVLGQPDGPNIALDENEIMARNNNGPAILNLQIEGGETHFGGPIDLNKTTTGVALRVDGKEALWYNGTYFSWGFGGSANFFSDGVGIGTASPSEKLEVDGNILSSGWVKGDRLLIGAFNAYFSAPGSSIYSSGNLLPIEFGPRSLGHPDNPWNHVYTDFDVTVVSDIRLKKDVAPLHYGLSDILALHPISYQLVTDMQGATQFGLSAQDVQRLIPEIVNGTCIEESNEMGPIEIKKSATLGIRYGQLIPILIKAIQEQNQTIDKHEVSIGELTRQLERSLEANERFESRLRAIEESIENK